MFFLPLAESRGVHSPLSPVVSTLPTCRRTQGLALFAPKGCKQRSYIDNLRKSVYSPGRSLVLYFARFVAHAMRPQKYTTFCTDLATNAGLRSRVVWPERKLNRKSHVLSDSHFEVFEEVVCCMARGEA